LHRSVREFLDTDDIQFTMSKALSSSFNADVTIAKAFITLIQRRVSVRNHQIYEYNPNPKVWMLLKEGLWHARRGHIAGFEIAPIVDNLRHTALEEWDMDFDFWHARPELETLEDRIRKNWTRCDKKQVGQYNILQLATEVGLCDYVKNVLARDSSLLQEISGMSILHLAFLMYTQIPAEMVAMLLDLGANPNLLWLGNSPWQLLLTSCHYAANTVNLPEPDWLEDNISLFEVMLNHGASPWTTCIHKHKIITANTEIPKHPHSVGSVIQDAFGGKFPVKAAKLQRLLAEKKKNLASRSRYNKITTSR